MSYDLASDLENRHSFSSASPRMVPPSSVSDAYLGTLRSQRSLRQSERELAAEITSEASTKMRSVTDMKVRVGVLPPRLASFENRANGQDGTRTPAPPRPRDKIIQIAILAHALPPLLPRSTPSQNLLTGGDANDDGVLNYEELASINPKLYRMLGIQEDVNVLLRKFDTNHDGLLDHKERRAVLRGLVPTLREQAKKLCQTGEYTAAGELWNNRTNLIKTIKADHAAEVEGIQKHFEREYRAEVEDREEAFFRVRITELYDALTAHWDAKEAFLERVLKQKLALFKKTKPHSKHPTGPRVTKFPPEVLELRRYLKNLSHARHPTDFQLAEGERMKIKLHKLEDEAHAKHATLAPAYYERELKKFIRAQADDRYKLKQLRVNSFDIFGNYVAQAREMLSARHRVYDIRMAHAHALGPQEKILEELKPYYQLQMLKPVDDKKPTLKKVFRRVLYTGPHTTALAW